tara:strand:- start:266 stop:970 length:705 start_codon:yes stop_codon:yes gene_type:complete
MGSRRLPGKSLFDLAGKPLVARILERVLRCKNIDDIILAIPDTIENFPLRDLAIKLGVNFYQGSEDDLVERYYQAAKLFKSEYICRLPADNPTPEPKEIDRLIKYHMMLEKKGFSTNLAEVRNSGYPDGIGVEIFGFNLLSKIRQQNHSQVMREHVHLNFYNYQTGEAVNEKLYPINTIQCPEEFRRPDLILDVNTKEQYIFMKELYEYLYPLKPDFTIVDIIDWYDNIYIHKR